MKLKDLGEFGLIERIRSQAHGRAGVLCGIGDDAAVTEIPRNHHLLTSTDLLVEDVHFRFPWTDPYHLGRKAVAVNLSDIAAMGGAPRYLYLGLACPDDTEATDLESFLDGVLEEASAHDVALVGGDTCRSPGPWMISVTVEGSVRMGDAVERCGARAGDLVMVSGTLGDSALALRQLQMGKTPDDRLLRRHISPGAQVALGRGLSEQGLVTAMIDVSDGLVSDLEHILQESGVDGVIDPDRLPLSEFMRREGVSHPGAVELALAGGEDYELLFTIQATRAEEAVDLGHRLGVPVTVVGEIREGNGRLWQQQGKGELRPILVRGYDHFCPSGEEMTSAERP